MNNWQDWHNSLNPRKISREKTVYFIHYQNAEGETTHMSGMGYESYQEAVQLAKEHVGKHGTVSYSIHPEVEKRW
jgi:hypothetical protein